MSRSLARALLALTTLKDYDNYTFTHMVNVSILAMAQARALGIDGRLLREFGMSALMHDIGYIQEQSEQGTGGQYTLEHVERSAAFFERYEYSF